MAKRAAGKAGKASKTPGAAGGTVKPKHSNDKNRANKDVKTGMRSSGTVRRLAMYNSKPVRNKQGKIVKYELQSRDLPSTRIQPDRRWFGNTRVVGQKQLEAFREEMAVKAADPYTVVLDARKLPLGLIQDPETTNGGLRKATARATRSALVATQPFAATFGKEARRKRPKLAAESVAELAARGAGAGAAFEAEAPSGRGAAAMGGDLDVRDARGAGARAAEAAGILADSARAAQRDPVFLKGQSKRIWGELYKVLDSSDIVVQVLDARDPMGTRSPFLERAVKRKGTHKQMLLLLNKCDLVPAWVTRRWLEHLSPQFPTLAFHASETNPFGKGALLGLLRQLARMRRDKQHVSVGLVGYPNVGKSSVVNALRSKRVASVAPVPGQTKVWQYVNLTKRIFLIDCPGVVHASAADTDTSAVLKGVVRVETLEDPTEHVDEVLRRVRPHYLTRAYRLPRWADAEEFLTLLARASGRLGKGGEPDLNAAARSVLLDWQRGKLPFFTLPPDVEPDRFRREGAEEEAGNESGDEGRGDPASASPASASPAQEDDGSNDPSVPESTRLERKRAAAAAAAVRAEAAEAAEKQRRRAIPVQTGFFDDVDERADEEEEEEESEGSEDDADEEEPAGDGQQASEDDADNDSDGDGYGDEGLSWEAVMASMQQAQRPPAAQAAKAKRGRLGGKRGQ